ncbi:Acyl-CoA dehydrogenase family member 10 [Paramyrothecium foliicola]|nr:Acyl-CoA dehydrogenase family member 10 [Paramyrothecium foliicola]
MAGRVRQPIDQEAFERYLVANVPVIKTPIDLKQFGFGQSNPTYQITAADGQRFVMRKKPPGKLISKTAHKVEREYRVMHALEGTGVAVPKMYGLCEDESIIGTPFYIMEFLDGRIIEDFTMPGVSPEERTQMWKDATQTLARLHAVDFRKVGLEKFGKDVGFYNRQIQTWTTICASQEKVVDVETKVPVGKLPHFDESVRFFMNEKAQPRDRATLVHGDYKIDNLVFHKTEPRVIGILEYVAPPHCCPTPAFEDLTELTSGFSWEMSTIGHPLSDVCNLMMQFYMAKHPGAAMHDISGFLPGRTPGMPQPEQIVAWYTDVSGYNPQAEISWGMAFCLFKLAAICQGIAARYAVRQASSEKAKQHATTRGPLAEVAWKLAQEAKGDSPKLAPASRNQNILLNHLFHHLGTPTRLTRSTHGTRMGDRRRIILAVPGQQQAAQPAPPEPDERRPLLTRLYTDHGDNDDQMYSCMTNPHSHLPVYTTIHRIRRDIISVVEDYLTLEQLRDMKINLTVVRPLVDKFYELDDISIIYCLLVNRAQFLEEQSQSTNPQNVNWTRATLCELIASRILRRFGEAHDGSAGLLLLAHILVAGFEPFQNAPAHIREEAKSRTSWSYHRTLPSLEVAILTESKHFLSSSTCQRVVSAIYDGRIIYTPSTFWDIIPDHYKLKPISLYDPRESPLLNQYRLTVPRTRNILESIQFAILLALYVGVMVRREKHTLTLLESAFAVYACGWGLDQFATILAHGWNVYTQNLWSFLDVTFILIYTIYLGLRVHGWRIGDDGPVEQAYDVLALAAPVLVPRLAFTMLSDNLVFLSLRSMMADFFLLTALAAWCFFGFLLCLLWLGEGAHPLLTILRWMIYIWFGLDGVGIQRSSEMHTYFGPSIMVAFAFLGNTLFLTILVSMLSNTFSTISSNAMAEIHFRRAVLTLEGVKADAVFAYQPPFNILAVTLFLPLKFVVSPRWFHKIHVFTVRLINLPLLLFIAVAERRLLWPAKGMSNSFQLTAMKWLWHNWHIPAHRDLRAVFDLPPEDDNDIAVDDDLTHHLIRRQFTRSHTSESQHLPRRPSRRDSMFPGIPPKLQESLTESEDYGVLTQRLNNMEKAMGRLEAMLMQLIPREEEALEDAGEAEIGDSRTLQDGDGLTAEASFKNSSQE